MVSSKAPAVAPAAAGAAGAVGMLIMTYEVIEVKNRVSRDSVGALKICGILRIPLFL